MGRITFQKLQKERKRRQKQEMKAEKRAQRKLAKTEGSTQPEQSFVDAEFATRSEDGEDILKLENDDAL